MELMPLGRWSSTWRSLELISTLATFTSGAMLLRDVLFSGCHHSSGPAWSLLWQVTCINRVSRTSSSCREPWTTLHSCVPTPHWSSTEIREVGRLWLSMWHHYWTGLSRCCVTSSTLPYCLYLAAWWLLSWEFSGINDSDKLKLLTDIRLPKKMNSKNYCIRDLMSTK